MNMPQKVKHFLGHFLFFYQLEIIQITSKIFKSLPKYSNHFEKVQITQSNLKNEVIYFNNEVIYFIIEAFCLDVEV